MPPSYLSLHRSGELRARAAELARRLSPCTLCPRECGADRIHGARGVCGASDRLDIASYHPHLGEEAPIVGRGGSGTIFFAHCSLRCVFCQNWEISHAGHGDARSVDELAAIMLRLQQIGCENVNLVTPTHHLPDILLALDLAAAHGLRLPVVYNTSGWERSDILSLLDGVIDVYLPDFKFTDPAAAARYCAGADSYPDVAHSALLEMHRQVGVARPDPDGIVRRGLMIRHLVMPNDVAGSCEFVRWVARHLPPGTYLNLMSQYRPCHRASQYPRIARGITRAEYQRVVGCARHAGLTNLDTRQPTA